MGNMELLDLKSITAEAVKEISSIPLERPGGFFNRRQVKVDISPETLREMLLRKVWGKGVGLLNTQEAKAEPLVAEKALSELMKRGAVKDKIIYKKDSFRLKLENSQYRAYTFGVSGAVYACPWPSEKRYEILMSGTMFADFILQFDAEIPEMVSRIPEIIEVLKMRELEERKRRMENELKEQVLRSLIEQYLKPIGLSVRYKLDEGDMVSMDISQTLTAHLEMPLAQMMDKLKDADAFKALLQAEEEPGIIIDDEDDLENMLIP
jgi:hypothetical protein